MRSLYLNKFGLMHTGLVKLIEDMLKESDEVILGICSAQFNDENKSPEKDWIYNCLTWEERAQAIRESVDMDRIRILPIDDMIPIDKSIPDNRWVDLVIENLPHFDTLYSERDVEQICFGHKGKEIRDIKKHVLFTDHCMRDKIIRGEIWEPYFLESTVDLLKSFDIEERYKTLYDKSDINFQPILESEKTYEWRTFEYNDSKKIFELPRFSTREIVDTYILSLTRLAINMKIRDSLKIKALIGTKDDIEEYQTMNVEFPFASSDYLKWAKRNRFPGIHLPENVSLESFLGNIPDYPNPYLMTIQVSKNRYMRLANGTGVEVTELEVLGEKATTYAIEGKSFEEVRNTKEKLGLDGDATNFTQFLEKAVHKYYGNEIYENMVIN